MVNLATLIAFLKKKATQPAPETERIIPLPPLPGMITETPRTNTEEEVSKAREVLKVLTLERHILGSALATIYDSHSRGVISQAERDRLVDKYKVDLDRLEKVIQESQRIVDLTDLETSRDELIRNFKNKLAEIDAQLKVLRSGGSLPRERSSQTKEEKSAPPRVVKEDRKSIDHSDKKPTEAEDREIADAEGRIEQIREEILKAMDRLEQIEAEG